jgi:hypothetical protein
VTKSEKLLRDIASSGSVSNQKLAGWFDFLEESPWKETDAS